MDPFTGYNNSMMCRKPFQNESKIFDIDLESLHTDNSSEKMVCKDCAMRIDTVAKREEMIWQREGILLAREKQLRECELLLEEKKCALSNRREYVLKDECTDISPSFNDKISEIETGITSLSDREKVLNEKEVMIDEKVDNIKKMEVNITQREEKIAEQKRILQQESEVLAKREVCMEQYEKDIKRTEEILERKEKELRERENLLCIREKVLLQKEEAIKEDSIILNARERSLNERERLISEREKVMHKQSEKTISMDCVIMNRESVLRDRERLLENQIKLFCDKVNLYKQEQNIISCQRKLIEDKLKDNVKLKGHLDGREKLAQYVYNLGDEKNSSDEIKKVTYTNDKGANKHLVESNVQSSLFLQDHKWEGYLGSTRGSIGEESSPNKLLSDITFEGISVHNHEDNVDAQDGKSSSGTSSTQDEHREINFSAKQVESYPKHTNILGYPHKDLMTQKTDNIISGNTPLNDISGNEDQGEDMILLWQSLFSHNNEKNLRSPRESTCEESSPNMQQLSGKTSEGISLPSHEDSVDVQVRKTSTISSMKDECREMNSSAKQVESYPKHTNIFGSVCEELVTQEATNIFNGNTLFKYASNDRDSENLECWWQSLLSRNSVDIPYSNTSKILHNQNSSVNLSSSNGEVSPSLEKSEAGFKGNIPSVEDIEVGLMKQGSPVSSLERNEVSKQSMSKCIPNSLIPMTGTTTIIGKKGGKRADKFKKSPTRITTETNQLNKNQSNSNSIEKKKSSLESVISKESTSKQFQKALSQSSSPPHVRVKNAESSDSSLALQQLQKTSCKKVSLPENYSKISDSTKCPPETSRNGSPIKQEKKGAIKKFLDSQATLLDVFANGSIKDIEHLIVSQNFDLKSRDKNGFSPLLITVKRGNLDIVNRLIDLGADYRACDYDGRSALHLAVISENMNMITLLLKRGLDPCLTDNNGQTPFHLAAENGYIAFAQKMNEFDIDLSIKDNKGHTVSDILKKTVF